MKTKQEIEFHCTKKASDVLLGRTIVKVSYLSDSEMKSMGWRKNPVVFVLDDSTLVFPSMDDEGNDGGSLFFQKKDEYVDVLPVI
jgi:hypothetical protein